MKTVDDKELLNFYIKKYNIMNLFDEDVEKWMRLVEYKENEHIMVSGEDAEYFYFHIRGQALIYNILDDGNMILLGFSHPLGTIGDIEIIQSKAIACSVKAITDCYCIAISAKVFNEIIKHNNLFLEYILRQVSRKLYISINTVSINRIFPVKKRLIRYLQLFFEDNFLEDMEYPKTFKVREIAIFIGASYRHLNRTITEIIAEDNQILERVEGDLIIKDIERLKRMNY